MTDVLTAAAARSVTFNERRRGYNEAEVDAFVDQVCDTLAHNAAALDDLNEQLATVRASLNNAHSGEAEHSLQSRVDELSAALSQARTQLAAAQQDAAHQREQIASLTQKIEQAGHDDTTALQLAGALDDVAQERSRNADMRQQLDRALQDRDHAQHERDQAHQKYSDMIGDLESTRQRAESLQHELDSSRAQDGQGPDELQEARERISELRTQLDQSRAAHALVSIETDAANELVRTLREDVAASQNRVGELDQARQQLYQAHQDLDQAHQDLDQARRDLDQARQDLGAAAVRHDDVASTQSRTVELEQQLAQVQGELDVARARSTELERELHAAQRRPAAPEAVQVPAVVRSAEVEAVALLSNATALSESIKSEARHEAAKILNAARADMADMVKAPARVREALMDVSALIEQALALTGDLPGDLPGTDHHDLRTASQGNGPEQATASPGRSSAQ